MPRRNIIGWDALVNSVAELGRILLKANGWQLFSLVLIIVIVAGTLIVYRLAPPTPTADKPNAKYSFLAPVQYVGRIGDTYAK